MRITMTKIWGTTPCSSYVFGNTTRTFRMKSFFYCIMFIFFGFELYSFVYLCDVSTELFIQNYFGFAKTTRIIELFFEKCYLRWYFITSKFI